MGADGPEGVWVDDQRFLSRHELVFGGERPRALAAHDDAGDAAVHVLQAGGSRLRLERRVHDSGTLEERLTVEAGEPAAIELRLGADFVAMLALRGLVPRPGPVDTGGPLRFAARGADGVVRATEVTASPAPEARGDRLVFGPESPIVLRYRFTADGREPAGVGSPAPMASVEVDDTGVARVLERALGDLGTLRSHVEGDEYFAAGVPWYATLFGRDSLLTAAAMLPLWPGVAERTIRLLGRNLGRRTDPATEEEPGKVLHELRTGEAAVPGVTPLARYFGTVDATPLLLCLLAGHAEWTGTLALFEELREEVDQTLGWLDAAGDLLAYERHSAGGLLNQGWKDSPDGIPDECGKPLEAPVALVEAQAYAIRAREGVAGLFERAGDGARASALRARAARHRAALERFWLADRNCYAMAVDGRGRPSRAVASNQGHLLWAGAVPPARARPVRDALMHSRLFSGWGVRTLAADEVAYDPRGYHVGAVWPHDTALAALGLRRHGFDADFLTLTDALLDAASSFADHRLPELMAGTTRTPGAPPAPYPASCRPQAWSAAALPQLVVAGLGLRPDPSQRRLHVRRPVLPRGVDRLRVRGLAVGEAAVDLEFRRTSKYGTALLHDAVADRHLDVVSDPRD